MLLVHMGSRRQPKFCNAPITILQINTQGNKNGRKDKTRQNKIMYLQQHPFGGYNKSYNFTNKRQYTFIQDHSSIHTKINIPNKK